jgi:hypothetical protein
MSGAACWLAALCASALVVAAMTASTPNSAGRTMFAYASSLSR